MPLPAHLFRPANVPFASPSPVARDLTDAQLIEEAVAVNHRQVSRDTAKEYRGFIEHFWDFLRVGLTEVTRSDVLRFLNHLEEPGAGSPGPGRRACYWCRTRGYPAGVDGKGCSASYRKRHLAGIRFLYNHCLEEGLMQADPAYRVKAPKVVVRPQYRPSREGVQAFLNAPGRPRDRLLAYWNFYAPSRRQTFCEARWSDFDLETGVWHVVGKGEKTDAFDLHPLLLRELRRYKRWQAEVWAKRWPAVRDAVEDAERTHVLLSRNGRPLAASCITKMLKWRAVRAGVGVVPTSNRYDCPRGKTSRVSSHALRRAWAHEALNDPVNPQPIDVVSEVLGHADIATTRIHYAPTKPSRARAALTQMHL